MDLLELAIISGTVVAGLLLLIPIVAILTYHRRKLEEMRLRHKVSIAEETRAAIEAVRKEFSALKDTTTEYDVSFDTALHRIENRMTNMEQRVLQMEQRQETVRLGGSQENFSGIH
jgi:hypothetical protein